MYSFALTYTSRLKKIFVLLAVVVALSVVVYGIFLLEAVGNTADRARAEREIRALTSRVSNLEQTYLSKTREMTLERALEMGLVAPTSVSTIYASKNSPALSLRR